MSDGKMKNSHSLKRVGFVGLLPILAILFGLTTAHASEVKVETAEFEGRTLYPAVKWIALEDLYATRGNVTIVDVRSNYEFATLRIKDAINIPLAGQDFPAEVKQLRASTTNPIVFYCNGRTCMKSYEAVTKAHAAGVQNVVAYDAGVFDWAKKYPEDAVLLGSSPINPARLLSKEKLAQHSLGATEFENRIGSDTIVLDVRDMFQQEATTLFPMVQRSVPLDNSAMKRYVDQAKKDSKTLLIYDAAGHQVQWLQYFLEAENVKSYFFLKGGARAYYDAMVRDLKKSHQKE
jgi:rhodanese-related sulfurtransferase